MSTSDLIYQTIHHGSPFEAFESNLFSYQELIDYIATNVNDIPISKLYVTFHALMRFYPPVYFYSVGKHLLSYLPNDPFIHYIYVIMGGSPELPISKDDPSNTLWSLIFDVYSDYINDVESEHFEKAMLLCNKITYKLSKKDLMYKDESFILSLYEHRCDKIVGLLPSCGIKNTLKYSIQTDWFEIYPSLNKFYEQYIDRIYYLKEHAPIYYSKLLDLFLNQLCTLTLRDFEKIDFKLLKKTCQCFPQQFTDIDIPEKYQRICIYPISVHVYILGLPCFPKIPNKKTIDDAILLLSKVGIDEYVKIMLEKEREQGSEQGSEQGTEGGQQAKEIYPIEQIANTEDTLYEKPEEYVSLDRFNIEENGKIYQFTRPEFKKLWTDKRNFWTKQPLSFSDLYTLQIRIQLCHLLNLPASDTFKVLLEKACNGTLYEESLQPEKKQNQQISQNEYQNYLITSMFQALLNNNMESDQ
jgi:hypothetical protein